MEQNTQDSTAGQTATVGQIDPQPEKDLLKSKSFWGLLAAIALHYVGERYGVPPAAQTAVVNAVAPVAVDAANQIVQYVTDIGVPVGGLLGLLGTLVRSHRITSIAGMKLGGK